MATLAYVGRNPDSDSTIVPKTYADSQQAALGLTTSVVNVLLASAATGLTSKSYVDMGDSGVAQKAAVTAADANYLAASTLGAASGVAKLDSSGNVPTASIPTTGVITDRVMQCYSLSQTTVPIFGGTLAAVTGAIGTTILTPGTSHTVGTSAIREYKAASITIPDPGYPYRPLPFAWVQGNASGGTNPGSRMGGNGNYGLMTVMPPLGVSDQVYGLGLCTASFYTDTYLLTPYAAQSQTQITAPPVTGLLTLDFYMSMFSTGNSYTFYGTNLNYFVLVVPSL